MVKEEISDSADFVDIFFFACINVLYAYLTYRLWKKKIDGAAIVVLLLFYLVFFLEFLSVVSDNTEGFVF